MTSSTFSSTTCFSLSVLAMSVYVGL
jgi:hypothetical protein